MIHLARFLTAVLLVAACAGSAPEPPSTSATPAAAERLTADTPRTTVAGNTFIAPAGWSIAVRGPATVLEPPERRAPTPRSRRRGGPTGPTRPGRSSW